VTVSVIIMVLFVQKRNTFNFISLFEGFVYMYMKTSFILVSNLSELTNKVYDILYMCLLTFRSLLY